LEEENLTLKSRNKSLLKSVELHMGLLQKSEGENAKLLLEMTNSKQVADFAKRELEVYKKSDNRNEFVVKRLKTEVLKLRNEIKLYCDELDALKRDPLGKDEVVQSMKQGIASIARDKQLESEARKEDRRQRQIAEDASKAMRTRITFLVEQLEQASRLAVDWQEQKTILKAEINSLVRLNVAIRSRLALAQQIYMTHHLPEIIDITALNDSEFDNFVDKKDLAIEVLAGLEPVEQLGGTFATQAAATMPSTPEAVVERSMFDGIITIYKC